MQTVPRSSLRNLKSRRTLAAAAFAAQMGAVLFAADTTYTGPAAGTWNVAANWNNGAPTSGNNTLVDNAAVGNVNVSVTASATTGTLNVSAGDQVTVNNNVFLSLNGNGTNMALNNAGTLNITAAANSTRLRVLVSGTGTLSGGGMITLSGANALIDGTTGARLVNLDNFIHGQGEIGGEVITITNAATIAADVNGGTLTLDPDGNSGANSFLANTGTLRAVNGGILLLTGAGGGTFNNAGGTIEAQDNSTVRLGASASVFGGALQSSGTGSIRVNAGQNGFLTNVTNNAMLVGENNSDLGVSNLSTNNGTVRIEAGANATDLEIQNNTSIAGTGTIILSGVNAGINGASGSRLTLGAGQTLRGEGRVGQELITLTNDGTIIADVAGGSLTIDSDANSGTNSFMLNNNLVRATNGSTVQLTGAGGGTFLNTSGTIEAQDTSSVQLTSFASITGGTFITSGSGSIRVPDSQNAFFTSVTNNGLMVSENNSDFGVSTSMDNNGTISIEAAGGATDIEIQNDTTISGNGVMLLSGANAGINGIAGSRLTIGAGQTLRGQGSVGQELITLTNNGVIEANVASATLTLDPDANSGVNSFLRNLGQMNAVNDGVLVLSGGSGGTFDNNDGMISASGGTVRLTNFASITGGTFNTSTGGSVRVPVSENAILTSVTNNGLMVGENNSDFGLSTSMSNFGTISIEAGINATNVEIQNDTTISGSGVLVLSGANAGINGIATSRLTNAAGHTIRGQGTIGQELITLTNQGLIAADVPAATLLIDPDANSGANSFMLNTGTLLATNGGTLVLTGSSGGTFSGVSGTITANPSSGVTAQTGAGLDVGVINGGGTFLALTGSTAVATHFRVANLVVNASTARIRAGGGTLATSKVNTLSLVTTARMDVNDSNLIIDYTGASPFGTIRPQIATAFGTGSWTGVGITSSAAASAAPTPDKTGLGYVEATDLFTSFPAVFRGQSVDATSVLIGYTLLGDANLDRTVNITDFARLAANFNTPSVWFNGDFNYDGNTNINDFALLAANFNKILPADLPRGAAVPEASSLALLGLAAALKCHRLRKSN